MTIPIVFSWPGDPVAARLVVSLNRPGGNATGIGTLNDELAAKRLGLLRELAPEGAAISVLSTRPIPARKRCRETFRLERAVSESN